MPPQRGGLVGNVARLTFGNVGSRVLGLIREQTVAAYFGTTIGASIFSAASRVPTMVYDLLIGGALSSSLVPIFAEVATRDEEARAEGTNRATDDDLGSVAGAVLGVALAVLIPVVLVIIILADPLMAVLGAGFDPEAAAQATFLVRLAMPVVILTGIAAVLQAMLLAQQQMVRPSVAPAVYNAGIIASALILTRWFGVASLVVGMLIGAVGQIIIQWPDRSVHLRIRFDVHHPAVRRILALYGPVAVGLGVSAVVIALDTRLASQTGAGTLAAMRYATTVVQLPLGLVATAIAGATLPVLARHGRDGIRHLEYRQTLRGSLTATTIFVVPLMVLAITLRTPIVRVLFARGAFDEVGVALTATALLWYAPQLPFVAIDQLLIAAFYAMQETRIPVLAGVAGAAIFATVAITTVDTFGMTGLVGANTVQHAAHATILAVVLARRGFAPGRSTIAMVVRVAMAAGAMWAVTLILTEYVPLVLASAQMGVVPASNGMSDWAESTFARILWLIVVGGIALAIYAGVLTILRGPEITFTVDAIRRRLGRRHPNGSDHG